MKSFINNVILNEKLHSRDEWPEKMIVQRIVLSCAGIHLLDIDVIDVYVSPYNLNQNQFSNFQTGFKLFWNKTLNKI
jgi:hypothetical protein